MSSSNTGTKQRYFLQRLDEIAQEKKEQMRKEYPILDTAAGYNHHCEYPESAEMERIIRRLKKTQTLIPMLDVLLHTNWYEMPAFKPFIEQWKRMYEIDKVRFEVRIAKIEKELQRVKDEGVLSKDFATALRNFSTMSF